MSPNTRFDMASSVPTIPIVDLALLSDNAKRPELIAQLRHAIVNVGFLYLKNHTVSQALIDRFAEYIKRLFELPQAEKDKLLMVNSPHFFGYSRFALEFTEGKAGYSEQIDFGTPYDVQLKPGDPEYFRHGGPCQVLFHTPTTLKTTQSTLVARRKPHSWVP